jgi:glycosyltransferase involved in cell wall biosynthesis
MKELVMIMPVYNEAENIISAVDRIENEIKTPHEIAIVYDFDEDTTLPPARKLMEKYDNISLVKTKYERGVLNAIKTGFEYSIEKGEFTLVTMADLSDPPSVINDMYKIACEKNADIVCGSRYMKGGKQIGGPFIKKLMSRIAGLTLHYFAGIPTHDATNSFKMYRNDFLSTVKMESKGGFEIGMELVVKGYLSGAKICETPTTWIDRSAGKSNFKLMAWLPSYLHWYFYAFKQKK